MRFRSLALSGALLSAACSGENLVLPAEGDPAAISIVQGDGQSGQVGAPLADSLAVVVKDTRDRPVNGARVAFVPAGSADGSVSPDTALTGPDGRAAASWTLGTSTGTQHVEASVVGAANPLVARFSAVAAAGSAAALVKVRGDGQSGPAGAPLSDSLVVRATDASGNGVSGVAVQWAVTGGGSVSDAVTATGPDGLAAVQRVLGPGAGTQTTVASAQGVAGSVTFTHTATPGSAARITIASGDNQTAQAGARLPTPVVVRVLDQESNPVANKRVAWVVTQGGGSADPASSTTDASGMASSRWTLGSSPGTNKLAAVVSDVGSVTFTATGTAPPPPPPPPPQEPSAARSSVAANPTSFVAGQGSSTITVTVRDANGNPLSGVAVTIAVSGDGNTVTQPTGPTNASGVATGSFTSSSAGTKTVSARAGSVAIQQTATVTVNAPPPPPPPPPQPSATRSTVAANPTSFEAGSGHSTITVTVRDADGHPLAGIPVTIAVSGADNTITQPSGPTNASGVATGSFTSSSAGTRTVSASAGSVAIQQTATVTVTEPPPPPPPQPSATRSTVTASPTSFTAGAGSSTITVTVRDDNGNPLAGISVALSVSGTGNSVTQPAGPTDAAGVATGSFTSTDAGDKTVSARAGDVSIQQTATVTVTAPQPVGLAIPVQPSSSAVSGEPFAQQPVIQLVDADARPVSKNGVNVSAAVASGDGKLGGHQSVKTDGSGRAAFRDLSISGPAGTYTLGFSAAGLTGVTSSAIQLQGPTAIASQLGFLVQPSNGEAGDAIRPPVQVAVEDDGGNVVPFSATITMELGQNPAGALLTGTLARPAVDGIATFEDLTLDRAGNGYTLVATSPDLRDAESAKFRMRD